jgi:hypothetical protein
MTRQKTDLPVEIPPVIPIAGTLFPPVLFRSVHFTFRASKKNATNSREELLMIDNVWTWILAGFVLFVVLQRPRGNRRNSSLAISNKHSQEILKSYCHDHSVLSALV